MLSSVMFRYDIISIVVHWVELDIVVSDQLITCATKHHIIDRWHQKLIQNEKQLKVNSGLNQKFGKRFVNRDKWC